MSCVDSSSTEYFLIECFLFKLPTEHTTEVVNLDHATTSGTAVMVRIQMA